MSKHVDKNVMIVRLKWAWVFVSGLVLTNFFLSFFCGNWSLFVYLIVGGIGAWRAESLQKRFSGDSWFAKIVRAGAALSAVASFAGFIGLSLMPVRWDTKCSWRYCGRAMGPGLFKSPFPVGTPTCRGWSVCANEYQYSSAEYSEMLKQIEAQGCPAP